MLWLIFQGLVFLAVVLSNLEWHWVENDNRYIVGGLGVAAAFGATVAVSWISEQARALKDRRRRRRTEPPELPRFEGRSIPSDFEH